MIFQLTVYFGLSPQPTCDLNSYGPACLPNCPVAFVKGVQISRWGIIAGAIIKTYEHRRLRVRRSHASSAG
jgi:hypothetical protein